jgi:hypothetical protein
MNNRELRQRVKKVSQVKEQLDPDGEDTSGKIFCGVPPNPDQKVVQKLSTKILTSKDSTKK